MQELQSNPELLQSSALAHFDRRRTSSPNERRCINLQQSETVFQGSLSRAYCVLQYLETTNLMALFWRP